MLLLLAVRLQLSCARFLPVRGGGVGWGWGGSRHICDANIPLFPPPRSSQVKLDPEQPPLHLSTGRAAKPISSRISLIRDFNMCHPPGGVGGGGSGGGSLARTRPHRPVLTAYSNYRASLSHGLHLCSEQITCDPVQHAAGGGAVTHSHSSTYTHTSQNVCFNRGICGKSA